MTLPENPSDENIDTSNNHQRLSVNPDISDSTIYNSDSLLHEDGDMSEEEILEKTSVLFTSLQEDISNIPVSPIVSPSESVVFYGADHRFDPIVYENEIQSALKTVQDLHAEYSTSRVDLPSAIYERQLVQTTYDILKKNGAPSLFDPLAADKPKDRVRRVALSKLIYGLYPNILPMDAQLAYASTLFAVWGKYLHTMPHALHVDEPFFKTAVQIQRYINLSHTDRRLINPLQEAFNLLCQSYGELNVLRIQKFSELPKYWSDILTNLNSNPASVFNQLLISTKKENKNYIVLEEMALRNHMTDIFSPQYDAAIGFSLDQIKNYTSGTSSLEILRTWSAICIARCIDGNICTINDLNSLTSGNKELQLKFFLKSAERNRLRIHNGNEKLLFYIDHEISALANKYSINVHESSHLPFKEEFSPVIATP